MDDLLGASSQISGKGEDSQSDCLPLESRMCSWVEPHALKAVGLLKIGELSWNL